jgi:hypothetical protein
MLLPVPPVDPPLEIARDAGSLLQAHADLVARFGLGVAPTFKQELNRVMARLAADEGAESARPIEGVTGGGQSGL